MTKVLKEHNSEILTLALQGAIANGTLRSEHFALLLCGKYLPRWIAESNVGSLFTYEQVLGTLHVDAVKKRVQGCENLEEMMSVMNRAKGAVHDLNLMREQWDETVNSSSKQPDVDTGTGKGATSGQVAASSSANSSSSTASQKRKRTSTAKSTATGSSPKASPDSDGSV